MKENSKWQFNVLTQIWEILICYRQGLNKTRYFSPAQVKVKHCNTPPSPVQCSTQCSTTELNLIISFFLFILETFPSLLLGNQDVGNLTHLNLCLFTTNSSLDSLWTEVCVCVSSHSDWCCYLFLLFSSIQNDSELSISVSFFAKVEIFEVDTPSGHPIPLMSNQIHPQSH